MKWVIADAGTYYEVGDFDGRNWKGFGDRSPNSKSDKKKDRLKFDYGDSYYAAQVFNQGPDGRVVHIGWLSSKQSGYRPFLDAGMPFTQQMSIPAEITLKSTSEGIRMYRNPVAEIAEMYIKSHRFEKISTDQANAKLAQLDLELIDATFNLKATQNIDFHVRGLKISYDKEKQVLRFFNSKRVEGEKAAHALGKRKKHPYRDNGIREIPTPSIDGKVKIRVLVDRASLEIFVNDGQAAASFVVVPDPANRKIHISGNTEFNSIEVNEIASIWQE
ncbi:SacC [Lentisphaera araneosa HTCC2155]|uniref:SacC n=1 Tax=Lentisphaera araneosa HTCC2155 TaxID=313628 RepID=A6DJS6_9BACT|nr:GH32 C-terminal domain-containing protein [Lentisphaera araneosa]EDM28150.1 SacC [Lentisphaera araneosa HTCC2155]